MSETYRHGPVESGTRRPLSYRFTNSTHTRSSMVTESDPGHETASWAAGQEESRPQSARIYDYLLGGKDNFAPDRAVGDALMREVPALPTMVRAQRAFLARAVRHLVLDAGVRQFLDIGTG